MRHYLPDDEARALADENARRRSVEPTGRGHNDYLRMRAAERAAHDPLGLDDEPDEVLDRLAGGRAMFGWQPDEPVKPVSVRMGKDRTVTLAPAPADEGEPFDPRLTPMMWANSWNFTPIPDPVGPGQILQYDPDADASWGWSGTVEIVSIDAWSSTGVDLHLVHGDRGSANLETIPGPDPAALNRKRHGAASVCPRHGPTRGGLCRKCRR